MFLSPRQTQATRVDITAYGLWQMKLGTKSLSFEFDGVTLKDLIGALAEVKGVNLDETLAPNGRLAEGLKAFVNGVLTGDIGTRLRKGDEIVLSSVFDGG